MRRIREFARDDKGGTLIEYGLILALIFVVMMVAVHAVAKQTINMYNGVSNKVVNATDA